MNHLSERDLADWEAAEGAWFADREARVDRLALLDVVRRLQEARLRAARVADNELARAIARAQKARRGLDEASALLEDAAKLASHGRT